jgi:hypothetical protein
MAKFVRNCLHLFRRQAFSVEHDGKPVPAEGPVRKYI